MSASHSIAWWEQLLVSYVWYIFDDYSWHMIHELYTYHYCFVADQCTEVVVTVA